MGSILMHLPAICQGQNKWANLSVFNMIQAGIFESHTNVHCLVNIVKVLGEGGFSFVYLAQDEHSGVSVSHKHPRDTNQMLTISQRQFALKKIRCPTGSEGVKEAMREVEAYRRFKYVSLTLGYRASFSSIDRHPNIIRILVSTVILVYTEVARLRWKCRTQQLFKTLTARAKSCTYFYHSTRFVIALFYWLRCP